MLDYEREPAPAGRPPSRLFARPTAARVPAADSQHRLWAMQMGRPLDPAVKSRMELAIGVDLSRIRVHDDAAAAHSAEALAANAYTVGRHIVFAKDRYAPITDGGARLLKHELIHAVQQNQADAPIQPTLIVDHALEREAQVRSVGGVEAHTPQLDAGAVGIARDAVGASQVPSKLDLLIEIGVLTQQEKDLGVKGVDTPELSRVRTRLATLLSLLAEGDPTRQAVLLHRGRLAELRDQLATLPMSSVRDPVLSGIRSEELLLQQALVPDITRLEAKVRSLQYLPWVDPVTRGELLKAEADLRQDWEERDMLSRVFPAEKATAVAGKYAAEVRPLPGGGCMTAVYKGLEALYSKPESAAIEKQVQADAAQVLKKTREDTNCVDRIMNTLEMHGKAGPQTVVNYSARAGAWVPTLESTVLGMTKPEYPGWYFFGLSVSGGWHSVILAVDNSQGGPPQVYWMDQYSRGFTSANNKTGKLDAYLKQWRPSYDFTDCRIWPLLPTPDMVIPVEVTR